MSDYWKDHYDCTSSQFEGSLLKQVGKTVNGHEVEASQVDQIIENIISVLGLNSNDTVVDLCCGNGLLTRRYAPLVKKVIGVDYTQGLIDTARGHSYFKNIEYVVSDVLRLDTAYIQGVKKLVMYEALQHFTLQQFGFLLDELRDLDAGAQFFIGSVPNRDKLRTYYDSEEKYAFYLRRENEGRPHIGRWWFAEEIEQLSSLYGFKAMVLLQAATLYTSHYRFDVLLEKQS